MSLTKSRKIPTRNILSLFFVSSYLSGVANTANGSTNNLLNLSDPRAQDLFFSQFDELITTFNCSRIWFDYNTPARQTHWNQHEDEDAQGLLELGFYRGLYAVRALLRPLFGAMGPPGKNRLCVLDRRYAGTVHIGDRVHKVKKTAAPSFDVSRLQVFDRALEAFPFAWIEGCASGGRMLDLGSLSRTMSQWINDDSVSDDRNRRLRLVCLRTIWPLAHLNGAMGTNRLCALDRRYAGPA